MVNGPKNRASSPLPSWVWRAIDIAVLPGDNEETIRTKRLLTAAVIISIPTSIVSALTTAYVFGSPGAGAVIGLSAVGSIVVLTVVKLRPTTYPAVMHFIAAYNILISMGLLVGFGGILPSGINAIWAILSVVGAMVVFADWRALAWFAVYILTLVGATIWSRSNEPAFSYNDPETQALVNLALVSAFVFFVLYYYVRQRALLLRQSDSLLRNVLPDAVADRLKTSPETIAERFESATILFADVADFTPLASRLSPEVMVALLDEVFSQFDRLVEDRRLEKIKTIGDAYMVAGGVPEPRPDHAHAICDLALEMMRLVEEREFDGRRLQLRMGISSGEVVAGVIGTKKFSYDLWGDAVNTASRMETSGLPGRIQITDATRRLIEPDFMCEPRGVVDIKGKGPMPVWFLLGRA
ncbi:MAG TPA: adenylate/guanylate cyclase domain-containing protein [Acidimicrobiia bacterium]